MNTVEKGRCGEELAAAYLERSGYQVVEKNFRTRWGEVDIITTRDTLIAFVEVKAWRGVPVEDLGRVFHAAKRRRMTQCAQMYLARHSQYRRYTVRFDLLYISPENNSIELYENILT